MRRAAMKWTHLPSLGIYSATGGDGTPYSVVRFDPRDGGDSEATAAHVAWNVYVAGEPIEQVNSLRSGKALCEEIAERRMRGGA